VNTNLILMTHVLFGMGCLIAALWVFVDALNVTNANLRRIRALSLGVAAAMWAAFLIAGYWYIIYYPLDRAVILKGPWPLAHRFFMESKEHFVIMLLLLVSYLPIAAAENLAANRDARKIVLWVSGLIVALTLAADGFGAIIAMGVKVALLPR
jgi:uncharacterized membrane protein YwaF